MKQLIKMTCVFLLLVTLFGCKTTLNEQSSNENPITFYVGLGNNQTYYEQIKEAIKEELGIDIQLVYTSATDTTGAIRLALKNNDLPADIVATASRTKDEYLKDSCLDLMAYTHLADYFSYQKFEEYTNDDGTVYQLPFSTKLIGITYNKTLMEENGFEVPSNYEEMLALKKECDKRGIVFAVSADVATGHGFNYLFHTMGADWLNTLEGSNWFDNFINGKEDVTRFADEASYFDNWVKNDLFGIIHGQDWAASTEFCSKRALFFFDLTNSIYSYEGEMVDADGNPTGIMLNDEYASMPWISEDGATNCFTYYDNMFIQINKKLGEDGQEERLAKVTQILEFLTSERATEIFKNLYKDGYVAVNSFNIDESRVYYKYKDSIEKGYIQPWYYNYFDLDTIVDTGEVINQYLRGEGGNLEQIMETLEINQDNYLKKEDEVLTNFVDDLSYEETAKLNAIGAIIALQAEYDNRGLDEKVDASLIAYVDDVKDLKPYTTFGVQTTRAYAGEFYDVDLETIVSSKSYKVLGVKMLGSKLKELSSVGLIDGELTYPYVLYSYEEIKDDQEYVVAVSKASLNENYLTEFNDNNAIISDDNNDNILATIKTGINTFLQNKTSVSVEDIK